MNVLVPTGRCRWHCASIPHPGLTWLIRNSTMMFIIIPKDRRILTQHAKFSLRLDMIISGRRNQVRLGIYRPGRCGGPV